MMKIEVTPERGPLWQRRSIRITGAAPGAIVNVRSRTERDGGAWVAQASFLVDDGGNVELDSSAPVSGDYRVADSMGLFWSQTAPAGRPGGEDVHVPILTELQAWTIPGSGFEDAPEQRASATVEQWLLDAETRREEINENGLVGTLFTPPGEGPFPTIIVMNGSGGGINEVRAAQYASRGIQAFALAYFRAPGLSHYISRTPLEYLERGIDYITARGNLLGGRPLVSGQSRGGELTLLLAARYPHKIAGVASFVPGAYVFGAQGAADPAEGWNGPTWTVEGEPLPHFWDNNTGVTWQPWDGDPQPDRHRDVYMDGLHDRELTGASRIPIENFPGPVACVSGLDDRAWPSSMASRIVMDTLARHGHSRTRLHLDYEAAGHNIGVPFLPATLIDVTHPVSGAKYSNGGTPLGNARASEDSFNRIVDFIITTATEESKRIS